MERAAAFGHGREVRHPPGPVDHGGVVRPGGRRLKSRLWASGRSSASADERLTQLSVVQASSLKMDDRPEALSPEFIRRRPRNRKNRR